MNINKNVRSVPSQKHTPQSAHQLLTPAWLTLPLSWWFLSGCTGRGLDTRLGLLLTLLALTEFIWGVVNLEEMSKPSQQKRRRWAHHLCLFLQHCTVCHLSPWLLEEKKHVWLCVIPLRCCYVLPRCTVAGGAINRRAAQSVRGHGHITWEDLSPSRLILPCSRRSVQYSLLSLFELRHWSVYPWNACCKLYLPVSQLEHISTTLIGRGKVGVNNNSLLKKKNIYLTLIHPPSVHGHFWGIA